MKTFHYYASNKFECSEGESEAPLSNCTSTLTAEMIKKVISEHAAGRPPFRISIPKCMLFRFCEWNMPASLLVVDAVHGKSKLDPSPLDEAVISFQDAIVHIHARRCVDILEVATVGEHDL